LKKKKKKKSRCQSQLFLLLLSIYYINSEACNRPAKTLLLTECSH
jgi:hypothetical protein